MASSLTQLESCRSDMLQALKALVNLDTPSQKPEPLRPAADLIERRFGSIGRVQRIAPAGSVEQHGDHLLVEVTGQHSELSPSLLLCHYDTVWPAGTTQAWRFAVEGDRATGPGVYDMKASIVMVEFALRALQAQGRMPYRPLRLLITSDEETGSHSSRELIEAQVRNAAFALVMEPALASGALKTERKGIGKYVFEAQGRSAHAGVEPEKGVSAIREICRLAIEVEALAAPERGTTISVGVISGGTQSNVIPAHARMEVDLRVSKMDEAHRIEEAVQKLRAHHPEASLQISGGLNRPPMERTPAIAALFEQAKEIGESLGLQLNEGASGGGSDGNFTAAIGIPTLDGLGPVGDGAHARHEQIQVSSLVSRTALLAEILATW